VARVVRGRHQQQVSKLKCETEALKERLEDASSQLMTVSDSRLQLEKSLEEKKLGVQRLQQELESARKAHSKEVGSVSDSWAQQPWGPCPCSPMVKPLGRHVQ